MEKKKEFIITVTYGGEADRKLDEAIKEAMDKVGFIWVAHSLQPANERSLYFARKEEIFGQDKI